MDTSCVVAHVSLSQMGRFASAQSAHFLVPTTSCDGSTFLSGVLSSSMSYIDVARALQNQQVYPMPKYAHAYLVSRDVVLLEGNAVSRAILNSEPMIEPRSGLPLHRG
jgi:hypothetical protein